MEPPGRVPPDRERLLILRNAAAVASGEVSAIAGIDSTVPAAAASTTAAPTAMRLAQLPTTNTSIKPTSLSLQPQTLLPAAAQQQQLTPLPTGNTIVASIAVTSPSSCNTGTSPALASAATAISATTQAATAFSGSSVGHHHHHQHQQPHAHVHPHHQPLHQQPPELGLANTFWGGGGSGSSSNLGQQQLQQPIEKLSRPMGFDKMEALVREMQDQEHGVPVRQQKIFLTSIPYAFMGYDLIEWLMDRLQIEESEALNIANQLCLHGYFFPVNDSKMLTVKDDSSLYRFQTPYYWPWQHKAPDNVEYAIYLAKRSLRNKQRHALEDYEAEALASLHKNLKGKWDFISMQAEEQVRLAKERKKGDKIVGDSQERAYWRVHRPPPNQFTPLEPCPIPSRDRQGQKPKKNKTVDDVQREVDYLGKSLNRTRMKMSQACESLVYYSETFADYDFFLQPALPSNPWVTEDVAFWQLNNTFVDIPTEKRVKRWAISIEELVCDPTGLQEFTSFLEKEYSHENIRFWIAVNRLRRSAHSQVAHKVNEIYEEFLKPGAPCEINIDGKTMESVLRGLKNPSRFTFDSASEHIYMLLLKKDCYPRFIRSDHYKRLLETGIQPSHKKRFFNFGGVSAAKKKMTSALPSQPNLGDTLGKSTTGVSGTMMHAPSPANFTRRRGSDRSLTGSAHELAIIGVNKDPGAKVPHSHSQSNLSDIPYRDTPKTKPARLETTLEASSSAVCPWDEPTAEPTSMDRVPLIASSASMARAPILVKHSETPWEKQTELQPAIATANSITFKNNQRLTSTSSDSSDVAERLQRSSGIRHQNTVDSGEASLKRLMPNFSEQRRASMSFTSNYSTEYPAGGTTLTTVVTTAPLSSTDSQSAMSTTIPPICTTIVQAKSTANENSSPAATASAGITPTGGISIKDLPSNLDAEVDDELNKLSLSERNSESSTSEFQMLATPTPPPITKITPPPEECAQVVCVATTTLEPQPGSSSPNKAERAASPSSLAGDSAVVAEEPTLSVVKEVKIELIDSCASESMSSQEVDIAAHELLEGVASKVPDIPMEDSIEVPVEELSPTTDEYQEGLHFGSDSKDAVYDYCIVDTDRRSGYVPPAPTPAPSMAPLAEVDIDPDEPCELTVEPTISSPLRTCSSNEDVRRVRKKRYLDGKKLSSVEEKDKEKPGTSAQAGGNAPDHNAVCPWEDENVSAGDDTFVKTYATLGYL